MQARGIMFHYFHGREHRPSQGSISANELARVLDAMPREKLLDAADWLWRHEAGALRAGDICLTFDDGLRAQFEVALPVLAERGLTAFWFVPTAHLCGEPLRVEAYRAFRTTCFPSVDAFYDAFFARLATEPDGAALVAALADKRAAQHLREFTFYSDSDRRFRFARDQLLGRERYESLMDAWIADQPGVSLEQLLRNTLMSGAQVRALAEQGHIVGLHSHTHPTDLTALTPAEQFAEYRRNFNTLLDLTSIAPTTAAHPCNAYNAATLDALARLDVRLAFRANADVVHAGPLEQPRIDIATLRRQCHSRPARARQSRGAGLAATNTTAAQEVHEL